jgi:glycosyltransferase involved in cell wall biosynthesis
MKNDAVLIKSLEGQDTPLVSIITIVYNNAIFIEDAIQSVLSQSYPYIEYIVIDGSSTDGTVEIIKKYEKKISVFISEPDKGIYEALNKGVTHSTGDIIAVLHSDDQFYNNYVVSDMVQRIIKTNAEFCFSDMVIVDGLSGKVLRYYMANYFRRWMFRIGWMPPHPTCFIKKSLFDEFGLYSTDYKVAGDFDFLVRIFYGREISWTYLNQITVKMRQGGISSAGWKSKRIIADEINKSLRLNDVWALPIFQVMRYFIRLMEFLIKPKKRWYD